MSLYSFVVNCHLNSNLFVIFNNINLFLALTNLQALQNGRLPIEYFPRNVEPESEPSSQLTEKAEAEIKSEIYDFELNDGHFTDNDDISVPCQTTNSSRKSKTKTLKVETFSCDVCGKVLSSKGNLKKHRVVHSSVKPWQCSECQMSFNQARDLNTHKMQKHSQERPHVCKVI